MTMETAAKIMGLEIRPGEPEDLTVAQLIRQRVILLSALEVSLGNVESLCAANPNAFTVWRDILRAAIQSVKGNEK
jgi:hypothetical protein